MNKIAIVAVIVAAALVGVVGVSVVQNNGSGSGSGSGSGEPEGDFYEFSDAKGVSHKVEVPLQNVSVVHKYIPIFMKILGVEKSVAGLDKTYGMSFSKYFENSFDVGTYSAPDGETMLKHGSKVLLTPVTMGISNPDALRELGIEVIYLDLTDPFVIKDSLKILAQLMGGTPEIMERYDAYVNIFDECFTKARSFDLSAHADEYFGLHMASSGFFQTHTSSAVKVIESVSGKCYTHDVDPNVRDTVYFSQDREVLTDVDERLTLSYMFVYTLDPEENFSRFLEYGGSMHYENLTCVKEGHLFSLGTDTVNGALSCISSLLYAKAFGADIGTSAEDAVALINTTFGLEFSTEDLLVAYTPTA